MKIESFLIILFCTIICLYIYSFSYWLESSSASKPLRVAVYTPYDVVPGGGERYLLTTVAAFQKRGYNVELMVNKHNKCSNKEFLTNTIHSLRVDINIDRLAFRIVEVKRRIIQVEETYDIFYLLGNEKMPSVIGMGTKLNMYMCQFPFDLDKTIRRVDLRSIGSYDYVFVNSNFTRSWYNYYSKPAYKSIGSVWRVMPRIEILYPPVEPFLESASLEILDRASLPSTDIFLLKSINSFETIPLKQEYKEGTVFISVLGRFFRATAAKGHDVALGILREILKSTNKPLHLYLIGNIHPDEKSYAYVKELKENATSWNLPVSFLTNAEPDVISAALKRSTILWHLTGLTTAKNIKENPANQEHFGIAVVEGMFAGCIPIVTNQGGLPEIIQHEQNGFLAGSTDEFLQYSRFIINAPEDIKGIFRHAAQNTAKKFHVAEFTKHFNNIIDISLKDRRHLYDHHGWIRNIF